MQKLKELAVYLWKMFTYKEGSVSKTAAIMSAAAFVALSQWFFLGFLEGLELWGFTLPAFNYTANAIMITTFAATYIVNHKIRAKISGDEVVLGGPSEEDEDK